MKHLLVISFYFPPIMSAGAVRIGKVVKYLPAFGWEPFVLTVQPKGIVTTGIPLEVKESVIFRTPYWDPVGIFSRQGGVKSKRDPKPGKERKSSRFHPLREKIKRWSPLTIQRMPDRMMGWYPFAIREGKRILKWDRIDAIFSSHPTPVSHLIAASLQKKARIPWVADYRDLWTGSTLRPYPGWLEQLERKVERKVLKGASVFTTVSEPLKKYLETLHGKPAEVIYNGFDPEDFEGKTEKRDSDIFTVVYSGTLYTSKQSPVPLFEALKDLRKKGIISEKNFRVRFIGVQEPPFRNLVVSYGLDSIVVSEPFQPYERNVATLKGADALLFFSWNEGEMEGSPTSKIFQYMGASRPILMVGDANRFVSNLVVQGRLGEVGKSGQEIASIITRWIGSYSERERIELKPDPSVVNQFDRRRQAAALAGILDRLCNIQGGNFLKR